MAARGWMVGSLDYWVSSPEAKFANIDFEKAFQTDFTQINKFQTKSRQVSRNVSKQLKQLFENKLKKLFRSKCSTKMFA